MAKAAFDESSLVCFLCCWFFFTVQEKVHDSVVVMIIGNKVDLVDERHPESKAVPRKAGQGVADVRPLPPVKSFKSLSFSSSSLSVHLIIFG